ncbi:MAG: hypothetical protein KDD47_12655, partial [Acidobacteria bacterium]|nr:hypothetical protein [Acidobacteriota bacterium]
IPFRAFVIVGAPFVPFEELVEWAVRSAEHALLLGAESVSLIPLREGNGAVEALIARGQARLPSLAELEEALDRCSALGQGIVTADLWDLERLAACAGCRQQRIERLRRQNLSGVLEDHVRCGRCDKVLRAGHSSPALLREEPP